MQIMRTCYCIFIFLFSFLPTVYAQGLHLLISQIGEGAYLKKEKDSNGSLARASFLPTNKQISVRANSGIETISAGYLFRYGAETEFSLTDESIYLHDGSIMIQSRKIGNRVVIKSFSTSFKISGIGTCMLEVMSDTGVKLVGVLGRVIISIGDKGIERDLLAGEMFFVNSDKMGIGDKSNINLDKVIETLFLLSGFNNSSSFKRSLESVSSAQQQSFGKDYRVEGGNNSAPQTMKITLGNKNKVGRKSVVNVESEISSQVQVHKPYIIPKIDPLRELLGRALRVKFDSPSEKSLHHLVQDHCLEHY